MPNNTDIADDLRRVMEFYQGLGFTYLPLRSADLSLEARPTVREESARYTAEGGEHSRDAEAELKRVREEIGDCRRCFLSRERKNIVFGEGNPEADLMFVGEGPGREEDLQARPFVGEAGKVLSSLIGKMGFRRQDVYIANVVKCRPPMNRDPEEEEIATCLPFLRRQIEIIRPRVIMCLGRISSHIIIGMKTPISRLRGRFYSYQGIPVMPTFHPAYLMRNPKDKWLTWDDAQQVLERLKSEKNIE